MCTARPSLELEGKQWHSFCLTCLKMKHSVIRGYSLTAQRYTRAVLCRPDVITFNRTSVRNNHKTSCKIIVIAFYYSGTSVPVSLELTVIE